MYTLSGRVALVTGAQRGIGLETARALRQRGARVVICDLDADASAAAAKSLGDDALGLGADVTDRARMDAVVAEVVERFGGLDVVVANAGIAPTPRTARLMDDDEFERVVDVDLMGCWRTVKAALPQIVERRGAIAVVSSIYAFTNGMGNLPYAVAKAGVEQIGRGLRTELDQHGVGVTTAYFGFIDTEMVHTALDRSPHQAAMEKGIPKPLLKRLPPSAAAAGIVRAIERGKPRVILPKRWIALSVLRGITGPLIDEAAPKQARDLLQALDR